MENKLEKNKCKNCPLKRQRKDLLYSIKIENLNPHEYKVIMEEIKQTIYYLEKRYNVGKKECECQKIIVTGNKEK